MFYTRGDSRGRYNIFDWSDPETDRLLDLERAGVEREDDAPPMKALHAHLNQARPYLFLWSHDHKTAWTNKVRNNTISFYTYYVEFPGWRFDSTRPSPKSNP